MMQRRGFLKTLVGLVAGGAAAPVTATPIGAITAITVTNPGSGYSGIPLGPAPVRYIDIDMDAVIRARSGKEMPK